MKKKRNDKLTEIGLEARWRFNFIVKRLQRSDMSYDDNTFVICRIIGNDLIPRHSSTQTLENLRFILQNEPDFERTRKLFIVNRIFDTDRYEQIIAMLNDAKQEFEVIPFKAEEYAEEPYDFDSVGGLDFLISDAFNRLKPNRKMIMRLIACRHKINYAMNVNGARNYAIEKAASIGDWIFPWDGNCTITSKGFADIQRSCNRYPDITVRIVPMVRAISNDDDFPETINGVGKEEPQLGFRNTSKVRFDTRYPYGIRDKTETLRILGVPGVWNDYEALEWLPENTEVPWERHNFLFCKGVAVRLSSGIVDIDKFEYRKDRHARRNEAILRTIHMLDNMCGARNQQFAEFLNPKVTQFKESRNWPLIRSSKRFRKLENPRRARDILNGRTFFVGIGAQKCGTTWLSEYFRRHPDVFQSPVKELNFFNQLVDNPLRHDTSSYQLRRIVNLIVEKSNAAYPPSPEVFKRMVDIAEQSQIGSDFDNYLTYFAARIADERAYGEISPSYSHLSHDGYEKMREINPDVHILFLMRDPLERTCSHIRHMWRIKPDLKIEKIIEEMKVDSPFYFRSDYGRTLDEISKVFQNDKILIEFYENLFTEASIRRVCEFLEVDFFEPNFSILKNAARGREIEQIHRIAIRHKLDPLYCDMKARFGEALPSAWNL